MEIDYSQILQESSAVLPPEYKEGYAAYPDLNVFQNPYISHSMEHAEWYAGWCDAEGYDDFTKGSIT